MKIAMIVPYHVKCGVASYGEALSNALVQLGVEIYIVRLPRFGAKNQPILRLVASKIPLDKIDLISVQEEYGLYQNQDIYFFNLLKQLGKPIVTTMHSVGLWEADQVIAQVSDAVIVHNKFCAKRFGYPTTLIPHGIKSVECTPNEVVRKKMGLPEKTPIVGYLGYISNYKGLETLISAMKKIPNKALLIAGGSHAGPDTEYMLKLKEDSLKEMSGRVQWLGYIEDERLPDIYGLMDIVCYPSKFCTESGALLTAIGFGKAVITSNLSPFREKEKQGVIQVFKNEDELVEMINMNFKKPELRAMYEQRAKEYAKKNSWENVAAKHVKLFKSVLHSYKKKKDEENETVYF